MIRSEMLDSLHVDCKLYGPFPKLMVEYNAVTTGVIKTLREREKMPDEEIEKLLVESIALAFRVADIPGGVKEL